MRGAGGPGFGWAGVGPVLAAAPCGACAGLVTAAGPQKVSRSLPASLPVAASVSLSACPPMCLVPQIFSSSANAALYPVTIYIFPTSPLSGTIPVFSNFSVCLIFPRSGSLPHLFWHPSFLPLPCCPGALRLEPLSAGMPPVPGRINISLPLRAPGRDCSPPGRVLGRGEELWGWGPWPLLPQPPAVGWTGAAQVGPMRCGWGWADMV